MMKRMMITETELMNVAGGLSPEVRMSLMEMRRDLMQMFKNGEISSEEFKREMEDIEEKLNRPGCVFTS